VANDHCNDHWADRNYVSLDRFEPIQNKRITTENSAHTNHQEGTCGTAQKESMAPPKGNATPEEHSYCKQLPLFLVWDKP
jgi:hypothetical protein